MMCEFFSFVFLKKLDFDTDPEIDPEPDPDPDPKLSDKWDQKNIFEKDYIGY